MESESSHQPVEQAAVLQLEARFGGLQSSIIEQLKAIGGDPSAGHVRILTNENMSLRLYLDLHADGNWSSQSGTLPNPSLDNLLIEYALISDPADFIKVLAAWRQEGGPEEELQRRLKEYVEEKRLVLLQGFVHSLEEVIQAQK